MPKTLVASLAAATVVSVGLLVSPAATLTAAAPAVHFVAADLVREAAIVCGGNGCNPVQTKAQRKQKFQTLGHG